MELLPPQPPLPALGQGKRLQRETRRERGCSSESAGACQPGVGRYWAGWPPTSQAALAQGHLALEEVTAWAEPLVLGAGTGTAEEQRLFL